MELDELKKVWNIADSHLNQKPLASEVEIEKLITTGKKNMCQKLRRLSIIQRISLGFGGILLLLLITLWGWMPDLTVYKLASQRLIILMIFIAVSLVGGLIWDWKTFRWIRTIRIDEMSVVEVSRRMTSFQRQIRNEIIATCIWIVVFNALSFWVMGYHLSPLTTQILVIVLLLILDIFTIYYLYKKILLKYMSEIHKNIEELKDICLE